MTQGERASLDRLEEKFDRWSERLEGKVDAIDGRLRDVEIKAAAAQGERQGGRSVMSGGIQAMLAVAAAMGALLGIPAAIFMLGHL